MEEYEYEVSVQSSYSVGVCVEAINIEKAKSKAIAQFYSDIRNNPEEFLRRVQLNIVDVEYIGL